MIHAIDEDIVAPFHSGIGYGVYNVLLLNRMDLAIAGLSGNETLTSGTRVNTWESLLTLAESGTHAFLMLDDTDASDETLARDLQVIAADPVGQGVLTDIVLLVSKSAKQDSVDSSEPPISETETENKTETTAGITDTSPTVSGLDDMNAVYGNLQQILTDFSAGRANLSEVMNLVTDALPILISGGLGNGETSGWLDALRSTQLGAALVSALADGYAEAPRETVMADIPYLADAVCSLANAGELNRVMRDKDATAMLNRLLANEEQMNELLQPLTGISIYGTLLERVFTTAVESVGDALSLERSQIRAVLAEAHCTGLSQETYRKDTEGLVRIALGVGDQFDGLSARLNGTDATEQALAYAEAIALAGDMLDGLNGMTCAGNAAEVLFRAMLQSPKLGTEIPAETLDTWLTSVRSGQTSYGNVTKSLRAMIVLALSV